MRVVFSVPSLEGGFGGPSAKARSLPKALRERGVRTSVFGSGRSQSGACGLPVLARFHETPVPRTIRPLRDAVRQADLVHIFGYRDPVGTVAAILSRRRGVIYVLEPCGMHRRRLRSLRLKAAFDGTIGKAVVDDAAAIVATSELEKTQLTEDGVQGGRIFVRPNGADLDGLLPLPERGALRRRLRVPEDAPLVLFLGRIAAVKKVLDLARAVAEIPRVWALVAGPDGRDGTLRLLLEMRRRLGLEDRLIVLSQGLWGRDKAHALADADCFCLPSATENFGTAAAEAACIGMPVVVSDQCGVAEYLDPSGSRVVPHGNVEHLTNAISEALTVEVQTAAKAAGPTLRKTLDWNVLARHQEEIYRAALEGAPMSAPPGRVTPRA